MKYNSNNTKINLTIGILVSSVLSMSVARAEKQVLPFVFNTVEACDKIFPDLRSAPIGSKCRTTKGAIFERVFKDGFGEAWKDPDGRIWSDMIGGNSNSG
ncbi:MAG: hypothetical protein ACXVCP_15920 [Bdellovibrio sp.]